MSSVLPDRDFLESIGKSGNEQPVVADDDFFKLMAEGFASPVTKARKSAQKELKRRSLLPPDIVGRNIAESGLPALTAKQQFELTKGLDKAKEIPLGASFDVGSAETDVEKFNILEKRFGAGNVAPIRSPEGEVTNFIVQDDSGERFVMNKPGFSKGDIFRNIAAGVQTVVPGAASVLGFLRGGTAGGVAAGAAADAGLSAVRQAVGASAGSGVTPSEAGKRVVRDVGLGAVGEGAGRLVPAAGRALRGSREIHKTIAREAVPEAGERVTGAQAAQSIGAAADRLGVDLSAAELTGGRTARTLERLVTERARGREVFDAATARKKQVLARVLDSQAEKLTTRNIGIEGAEELGKELSAGYRGFMRELARERSRGTRDLFKAANDAAAGQRVIPMKNTVSNVQSAIEEATTGLGENQRNLVAGRVRSLLGEFMAAGKKAQKSGAAITEARVSPQQMQNLLERWGNISTDLEDALSGLNLGKAKELRLARMVEKGLRADLDAAVGAGGLAGEAASALKGARRAYAELSAPINESNTVLFHRMFGREQRESLEKLGQDIISGNVSTGQVKNAVRVLKKTPQLQTQLNNLRGQVLRDIAERATTEDGLVGPGALSELLRLNSRKLSALMDTPTFLRLKDVQAVSRAMAREAASRGSSESVSRSLWMLDAAKTFLGGDADRVATVFAAATTPENLARILNDKRLASRFSNLVSRAQKGRNLRGAAGKAFVQSVDKFGRDLLVSDMQEELEEDG